MGAEVHSQAKTFRNVALFFAAWVLVCVLVPFDTDLRIGFGILGGLGALGFTLAWLLAPRPLAVEAPDVLAGVAPDCFAAAMSASASGRARVIGFSTSTETPRSRNASAISWCFSVGAATVTASTWPNRSR